MVTKRPSPTEKDDINEIKKRRIMAKNVEDTNYQEAKEHKI